MDESATSSWSDQQYLTVGGIDMSTQYRQRTLRVKATAREAGADLVGIAPIDRFSSGPLLMRPESHMLNARSVITFAIHYPDITVAFPGGPTPNNRGPFEVGLIPKLEEISFHLARVIEKEGYEAYPLPGTGFWRMKPYRDLPANCSDFSNMHSAVAAGLGEFGWHGLLITPEYGPRVRLASVITNMPLEPDPIYEGPPLCDRCLACVENCPSDAFRKELGNPKVRRIEIGGRSYEYANKNLWRCAWGEQFGLDVENVPENVNERVIMEEAKKGNSFKGGEFGVCLCVCLPPHLRSPEQSESPYPRRKREAPCERVAREQIEEIAAKRNIHKFGVAPLECLEGVPRDPMKGYPWKQITKLLPNFIIIGINYGRSFSLAPQEGIWQDSFSYLRRATSVHLCTTALDIARCLDNQGYDAMVLWQHVNTVTAQGALTLGLADGKQDLGLFKPMSVPVHVYTVEYDQKSQFAGILTNAPLEGGLRI